MRRCSLPHFVVFVHGRGKASSTLEWNLTRDYVSGKNSKKVNRTTDGTHTKVTTEQALCVNNKQ